MSEVVSALLSALEPGQAGPDPGEENDIFMHTPGIGVVWGSVNGPRHLGVRSLLPTKNLPALSPVFMWYSLFLSASLQVASMSLDDYVDEPESRTMGKLTHTNLQGSATSSRG